MTNTKHIYRPDIDGLRAVAVLAVICFHAFPNHFPGGFVGVDVFFIISGFLITGIILEAVDNRRFTFTDFYVRRVRRIFPALALVLACSLVAGWLLMMPNDFRQLGKHTFGGSAFIANFFYFFEADYFDGDAGFKPLLHLWSLGVEEQYYLLWPVLLLLTHGRRSTALRMIIAVGLASFALSIYLTPVVPAAAFYLPFTRFWELMLGSGLAVLRPQPEAVAPAWTVPASLRHGVAVAGAAAIVASLALIDTTRQFPGWWALLVAAGSTAVIGAGPATLVGRLLSLRPIVFVGLISYPLYLWHWPLISFSWHIYGWEVPRDQRIAMVLLAFVLAWLTYKFVEGPVRARRSHARGVRLAQALAAAVAILGATGALAYLEVLKSRSAADPKIVAIADALQDGTHPAGVETMPGTGDGTVLFIGDSHMAQYRPRLQQVAAAPPYPLPNIEMRTIGDCPPLPRVERVNAPCSREMSEAFERARAPEVRTVVLAAAWVRLQTLVDLHVVGGENRPHLLTEADLDLILGDLTARIAGLRAAGKHVIVLTSSPGGPAFDPRLMVERSHITPRARYRAQVPRDEAVQASQHMDARVRAAAQSGGATVVDPSTWICPRGLCPAVDAEGRPMTVDGWHMRPRFVRENLQGLDGLLRIPPQVPAGELVTN